MRRSKAVDAAHRLPRDLHDFGFGAPADRERQPRASYLRLPVPEGIRRTVKEHSDRGGVTEFTVWLHAFVRAVGTGWDASSFVVGVATSNRPSGCEATVGMFVSTVPVAVSPGTDTINDTARRLREALAVSDLDLQEYVSAARERGLERDQVIPQIAFSQHVQSLTKVTVGGEEAAVEVGIPGGGVKFACNVVLVRGPEGDALQFEYDESQLDADTIWALWTRVGRELVVVNGPRRVPSFFPQDSATDKVALRDGHDQLRYRDLEQLARRLATFGEPGDRVGVLGAASAHAFATEYALHLAGRTFVPLDPNVPTPRLQRMVEIAECTAVIDLDGGSVDLGAQTVSWDDVWALPLSDLPALAPETAYVMFTSGSTGEPKAVRVPSEAMHALGRWGAEELGLDIGTRIAQTASIGFDASIWETWTSFSAGSELLVVDNETKRDPVALVELMTDELIEVAFAPTPTAHILMDAKWPDNSRLRVLGAGGDRLHAFRRPQRFEVVNLYGPTECTSVVSAARVHSSSKAAPTIGPPLPHAGVSVVDDHGGLVGSGEAGELLVSGPLLAIGYIGIQDKEDSRFVLHPHEDVPTRAYRTGDIVRRLEDGSLEFLGRRDRQIKIAGVRIELGDVEAIALSIEGVRRAVVDVVETPDAKRLVIRVEAPGIRPDNVTQMLREALPTYVRTSTIEVLEALPLTANGKVANLPARNEGPVAADTAATSAAAVAPRGTADFALARAATLVGTNDVEASWLALGGSSLAAAQFVSWWRSAMPGTLSVVQLLRTDNVASLIRANVNAEETPLMPATTPSRAADDPGLADIVRSLLERLPENTRLALAAEIVALAARQLEH
ncbi:Linear gramicidin synthase subunit D [Clavibacter michiganensis]|nr:Linear gramicidin synthase subunit D [Clavibacter michiganensis]